MEKIAYLLRKGDGQADAFRDRLFAKLPTRLPALGAESLAISVVDSDVAAGTELHIGAEKPDALLTFWLEAAQGRGPIEEQLALFTSRRAGYLVVESRPLISEAPIGPGERTPGFNLVGCITPKPGMPYDDFVRHWHGVQRELVAGP